LGANVALHLLAQAALALDEHERALRYFREALVLASEAGDKTSSAYCIQGLADVAGAQGHRSAPRGSSGPRRLYWRPLGFLSTLRRTMIFTSV